MLRYLESSEMTKSNQELAFDKLSKLKCGALFMEMGTGKTKVALDLMASKSQKVDNLLWICPCSLKGEIEAERQKWHPELNIIVYGCESIGASSRIYTEALNLCKSGKTFTVVDESLKIKNKDAKRTYRILEIGKNSEYRLILNGTPVSRNILDLWTQMEFLSHKILDCSYSTFKRRYCEFYVRGPMRGKVKTQHNVEHLTSLIEPYIFDAELEIEPNKMYHNYTYYMTGEELSEYNSIKRYFLEEISDCDNDIDFYRFTTALQKQYTKSAPRLVNMISEELNEPVIVFVKYLQNIPDDALSITGKVKPADRHKVIEEFRERGGVLYITYGCGSYGLNLQFCRHVIFAEHTFDYSQKIQAEARVYRIGQESDVHYYDLWCDCGLEALIQGSIRKKSNLLDAIKAEIDKLKRNDNTVDKEKLKMFVDRL